MIRLLFAFGMILTMVVGTSAQVEDVYAYFRNYNFGGGLNTATSPFMLQDNEAANVSNMIVTTEGAVESRGGFARYATLASTEVALSMFRYYTTPLVDGVWVAHAHSGTAGTARICVYNTGTGLWGTLFNSSAVGHFHEATAFANLLGRLYFTNTADGLRWYDSAAGTTGEVSTTAECQFLQLHNQRLYMAGDPIHPATFYFSGLRNGTIWDDATLGGANAGYWDLPTQSGGAITGLAEWQSYLLIFTEDAIWALQGDYPDISNLTQIAVGIGCSAPYSIQTIGGDVFFKSGSRIYKMAYPPVDISKKLYGYVTSSDGVHSVGHDRRYWITNQSGNHDVEFINTMEILIYDIDYDRWTKFTHIPFHVAATSSASRDTNDLLMSRSDSSEICTYETDHHTDTWGNYDKLWKSRVFHLGSPELDKQFRHFQIDAFGSSSELLANYEIDYGRITHQETLQTASGGGVLGDFTLGTDMFAIFAGSVLKFPFHNNAIGKTIQFMFSNSNDSNYTKLFGFVLRYRPKSFRGSAF